jgi:predicted O-methyltransferase YrrM
MTATWQDLHRPEGKPSTPVEIFQHEWEFEQLLQLYRRHDPHKVLEIGTFHGGSLYHFLREAPTNAVVVSVDSYATGVDNRHLYPRWTPDDVDLYVIAGDSHDQNVIGQVTAHAFYDFVFIDAGHLYHEVATDWRNYKELVEAGGIVALHDIVKHPSHPEIEVDQLWDTIRRSGYITQEYVCSPDQEWGGIGVVYL